MQAEKWSEHLGRGILACCHLEYLTYQLLVQLPAEPIANLYELDFCYRAQKAIKIVKSHSMDSDKRDELIQLLEEVIELSKTRNLIIHNPLMLNIYENEEGQLIRMLEISKHWEPDQKIDLPGLQRFADRADLISKRLFGVWYRMLSNN